LRGGNRNVITDIATATRAESSSPTASQWRLTDKPQSTTDLLPVAQQVAAGLGDRLSRDALVKGIRSQGHSVPHLVLRSPRAGTPEPVDTQ
jgi:hypothetical protein